jgi:hypothetical protein
MIPYGLPLIYSTVACDPAPSVRLFLLPLSPPPWGSLQEKRQTHDDEDSQQKRPRAVHRKAVAAEEFQVWKLAVRPNRTATLTCDDGNGNIVFTKEIEHTDFPLDEITLYFANNVIHLPSEY